MKVKDHNKFRLFDYENEVNPFKYQLGYVLYKEYPDEDNQKPEIGVVIQTFSNGEVRTDTWGMCSEEEVSIATLEQIKTYREDILSDILIELTYEGISAIQKLLVYVDSDEREHLQECIYNTTNADEEDLDLDEFTDDELHGYCVDNDIEMEHVWHTCYKVQKIIE